MGAVSTSAEPTAPPPDDHNEIGVLRRREIEARIVGPLLGRLGDEFGHARVREIALDTIAEVARSQGSDLAGGVAPPT